MTCITLTKVLYGKVRYFSALASDGIKKLNEAYFT